MPPLRWKFHEKIDIRHNAALFAALQGNDRERRHAPGYGSRPAIAQ